MINFHPLHFFDQKRDQLLHPFKTTFNEIPHEIHFSATEVQINNCTSEHAYTLVLKRGITTVQ